MDDHHEPIAEDRCNTFERQRVVLSPIDCPGRILDLGGGGEGIIGRLMGERVVAIDRSRRELEETPSGPLKILMDATELRFLDGSFGAVTSFFTLMYVKDPDHPRIFAEAFRVLVPGGRFLIWDMTIPRRDNENTDIAIFPLDIVFPDGGEIGTGYGVRWPVDGREAKHFVRLAKDAGFDVVSQTLAGRCFFMDLRKP